jgi:hypothetical protein
VTAVRARARQALADPFATPDDRRGRLGRRAWAFDAALVGVLLLTSVGAAHHHLHDSAGGVAAGVMMVLALLGRRRWPVPVFGVVVLAAFAQWLLGASARPQDLAC